MFSTAARLKERQGRSGTSRLEYLQALVTEFQTTQDEEAKEQIVANLANFAYDPINYDYMRKLNVFELFLDCLTEENAKLIDFGMGDSATPLQIQSMQQVSPLLTTSPL
ncbi:hypothetical protein CLOM_g11726 [Closterium sp. NIES-68]|nr:hypothetical protein CLOM_g11726 [Closterium sp. NIES-68]